MKGNCDSMETIIRTGQDSQIIEAVAELKGSMTDLCISGGILIKLLKFLNKKAH